jgi:TP901 family phage tail tape measure protein
MSGVVVEQLIIPIIADGKQYSKVIKGLVKDNKNFELSAKNVAKAVTPALLTVAASATALGVKATNAFKDFETGVTSVAKTTNLAGKDLEDFKDDIISMSERIPVTTDRLLEIATAAGQLGITGTKNLSKFTETIAKLGATTDLEGEQAAIAIARILNLTNESIDSVDKLGSTLVDLGNNFAASESEILEVAKDVAKATVQFGLSSEKILGISASMASLGIEAEAGGTVIGKAFQAINEAVRSQGGPAFEKLLELTALTKDELTDTFQKDAAGVFQKFIEGLGKAGDEGKDLTKELEKLGLRGIRIEKILPTLANRADILGDSMLRAGRASKEGAALNDEAAKAFDTANNRLIIAQNKLNNMFVKFGAEIAPEVVKSIELVVEAVEESGPVIEGLAKSFAFVVENGVGFIKYMQDAARVIRNVVSGDEALIKAMNETAENEKRLNELLKERGITLKQFREEQRNLARERKEASEQATKEAKEEAAAQAKRTAALTNTTGKYIDGEKKKTKTLLTESEKREKKTADSEKKISAIKDQAAKDAIKKQEDKNKKLLEDQEKTDQEMFDDIAQMSDEVEADYEDSKSSIVEIDADKWESLNLQQQEAYLAQIDAAANHAIAMGELEKAGELQRYKAQLTGQDKREQSWKNFTEDVEKAQKKHGLVMGALVATQENARYNTIKTGLSEVAKLTDSENNELKEIGKAATLVQLGMSTVEGATKAYSSLAWIPYVGVPLGVAAASVVAAYGLEQANRVRAMKTGGVFGTDGRSSIVPGVGTGDKINAILEPGELVVPRDITRELMKEYGIKKFAEGGVAGDDQKTGLHKTFAQIFKVPEIFKALIAGEDGSTEANIKGGFGASAFDGMIPAMMDALRESAYTMQDEALSVVPGGPILAALQRLINKPIDEIHDIMQDNEVTKWIGQNLGSDAAAVLTGGGPLTDAVNDVVNNLVDDVNRAVGGFFGFQGGGMPGLVAPGEMRISKDALRSISTSLNMSQNVGAMRMSPSMSRSTSNQGGEKEIIIRNIIDIADGAIDFITAKQREKTILGY